MTRRNRFLDQLKQRQEIGRRSREDSDQDKLTSEVRAGRRPLFHNPKRRPYWK